VLPAAASLQKQGANKGATTAFLISTPESGVDSIAVTYALLDPIMTVVRPVAAFFTAISAGITENLVNWTPVKKEIQVSKNCPVDNCCDGSDCPDEIHNNHHTRMEKVKAGFRYAMYDVWGDIVIWFLGGLVIASIITVLIPDQLMERYLGGGLASMGIMLLVGVPLYICATASTPVAAALILKGVSPGAALVFLLVGPATNITSLSVLVGVLGKKSTMRYLAILSICAVLFGLGLDYFYNLLAISPKAIIGGASEVVPYPVKVVSVGVLAWFSVRPIAAWLKKKFTKDKGGTTFVSGFPA
jgi:uncharacterized membrane protein YraQ (UPF0718 family)